MGGGYKNKVTPNKNKTLLIVLGIFALVIVTTAASFAFFTYSRVGSTTSTVISGDIEFSYIEGESATLTNAFPVKDSVGAIDEAGEYEFQVKMKSSSDALKVDYNVYLVDNNGGSDKYFTNEQIKFALLKNEVYVANTSATSGVKLSELAGFNEGSSVGEGMVLENQEISNNVTDNYKLRIWISDDVNYSNTSNTDDNTDANNDSETSVGKYNGYKYSLKVKVTSGTQTSTTFDNINVSGKDISINLSDPNGLSAYAITNSTSTPSEEEWIEITNDTVKSNVKRTSNGKITSKTITYTVEKDGVYYLHVKNKIDQISKKRIIVGKGSEQTISFDANGGTTSTVSKIISYSGTYGELPTPTRNGYNFTGWYTSANGENAVTSTSVYSNVFANTLYAGWEKAKYTVTINPNEGTYEDSTGETNYILEYQEEKNIPVPTRVGYSFDKWVVTGTESEITDNVFKMGYEDATLKATWKINSYTLTVDPNGGTWNNSTTSQKFTMEYKSTKEIVNPTRDGYTFTGWQKSGTNAELNSTTFKIGESDASLKATWQVNSYKYITKHYQQNVTATGYTLVSADTEEKNANFGTQVTPATKTYTGFTSPSTKTLTITSNEAKNLVEYQYARNKYKLTINPNGGKYNNTTSNTTVDMYYKASTTVENPTKTGHDFKGWTVSSGSLKDKVFTISNNNATLTANYQASKYVVTFNANGGTTPTATKEVTYNSTYGTLPTPSKTGYTFSGWYTAASGGTKVSDTTKVTITDKQTLYAHWTINNYTVTLNTPSNGKLTAASTSVAFGGTTTLTVTANSGYAVSGLTCTNGWTISGLTTGSPNKTTQTVTLNNNNNTSNTTCTATFKYYAKLSTKSVGQYVSMTPTSTSYPVPSTSGASGQSINPSELKLWRIIKVNSDGTVDCVSEYVSSKTIKFAGADGYKNYVGVLNEIAKAYMNNTYTSGARAPGYTSGTVEYQSSIALVVDAYSRDIPEIKSLYGSTAAFKVNATSTQSSWWIGARYGQNISGQLQYRVRYAYGDEENASLLYRDGYTGSKNISFRPVIIMKNTVYVKSGSGSISDPYQLVI